LPRSRYPAGPSCPALAGCFAEDREAEREGTVRLRREGRTTRRWWVAGLKRAQELTWSTITGAPGICILTFCSWFPQDRARKKGSDKQSSGETPVRSGGVRWGKAVIGLSCAAQSAASASRLYPHQGFASVLARPRTPTHRLSSCCASHLSAAVERQSLWHSQPGRARLCSRLPPRRE